MSKSIYYMVLMMLLAACNNSTNEKVAEEQPIQIVTPPDTIIEDIEIPPEPLSMLDSLRYEMADLYNRNKEAVTQTQEIPAATVGCLPCDFGLLAELYKKEQYTQQEIRDLVCIYNPECNSNVEFSQMVNEVFFRMLNEEPIFFIEQFDNPDFKGDKDGVLMELAHPVHDGIQAERIIERAIRAYKEEGLDGGVLKELSQLLRQLKEENKNQELK